MPSFNLLAGVALAYVGVLFAVAFWADRRARIGRGGWSRSPLVYTLSLSIYCTGWTFYGAVGSAARSGLEFITIYLGPTLVMIGWWTLLRKLVRIGRSQRITSIADLISSRYGKSTALGVLVTVLAVLGTTPYIALQLQSVTLSFGVFSGSAGHSTGIWVAGGLALFTIVFGTRTLDANERHHGVVMAIAVEAVVKLVALLAVGVFATWSVSGGVAGVAERIAAQPIAGWQADAPRWIVLTGLSAMAFLCLPRMFQVLVVENADEAHLYTAAWAFPLYLILISLFVLPIAAAGLSVLPAAANPDLFVLTLPLALGQEGLAVLSFIGGFSAATSMVIVAAIALSTMVSNHIVMPIWLSARAGGAAVSGDVREAVLLSRRLAILGVLGLGYGYYRFSGGGAALATMGVIAFLGVAQVMPALIGGLYWRGATRIGAGLGIGCGFVLWAWTLYLPSFGAAGLPATLLTEGPFGLGILRPQALFGLDGLDPLVHATLWSLSVNTAAFTLGSMLSFPRPLERLQGATFTGIFRHADATGGWGQGTAEAEDLLIMAQRILGPAEAQALFASEALRQGAQGHLPAATPAFLERLERQLAGSVGAATAHAMLSRLTGGATLTVEDLMRVADETAQMLEEHGALAAKSAELEATARQLAAANAKLTQLSVQKDAFLGQISHELRTPMTSIRAFSGILRDGADMEPADRHRFCAIIHDEAGRLTRLLDDLLDLAVLEGGQGTLALAPVSLRAVIDRAVAVVDRGGGGIRVLRRTGDEEIELHTDADRLGQVFINVIANAQKYCDADEPALRVVARRDAARVVVDLIDNGSGIPAASRSLIFEKFARLSDPRAAGGAGLGLAICREILTRLGGSIDYLPGQGGAAFRIVLPLAAAARRVA